MVSGKFRVFLLEEQFRQQFVFINEASRDSIGARNQGFNVLVATSRGTYRLFQECSQIPCKSFSLDLNGLWSSKTIDKSAKRSPKSTYHFTLSSSVCIVFSLFTHLLVLKKRNTNNDICRIYNFLKCWNTAKDIISKTFIHVYF